VADLNREPAQRSTKALIDLGPALWDAFFGNMSVARKSAGVAADLAQDRDVEYGAAFALALSGESSRSRALAKDLETRFPEDTAVHFMYLPQIRALLELDGGEPSKAIELLQIARPYERGIPPSLAPWFIGPFFTAYVRGLAYLAARQGSEAAGEFQKVIDGRVRQTLFDAVIRKRVAVESRQTFAGTEPKEAARIAHDLVDVVVGQAVSDSVRLEREAFADYVRRNVQTHRGANY